MGPRHINVRITLLSFKALELPLTREQAIVIEAIESLGLRTLKALLAWTLRKLRLDIVLIVQNLSQLLLTLGHDGATGWLLDMLVWHFNHLLTWNHVVVLHVFRVVLICLVHYLISAAWNS